MATINEVPDGAAAQTTRETWNANDTAINAEVEAATTAITAINAMFTKSTINLVADINYPISNPFAFPIVPNMIQIKESDGTFILDIDQIVNPANGNITLNSGASYTGAIITIIGW